MKSPASDSRLTLAASLPAESISEAVLVGSSQALTDDDIGGRLVAGTSVSTFIPIVSGSSHVWSSNDEYHENVPGSHWAVSNRICIVSVPFSIAFVAYSSGMMIEQALPVQVDQPIQLLASDEVVSEATVLDLGIYLQLQGLGWVQLVGGGKMYNRDSDVPASYTWSITPSGGRWHIVVDGTFRVDAVIIGINPPDE